MRRAWCPPESTMATWPLISPRREEWRHRRVRRAEYPRVVAAHGQAPLPEGPPSSDLRLICADSGGSNGYRCHLWKRELQRFATYREVDDHGMSLSAGRQQVKQDQASPLFVHHRQLARPAPDRLPYYPRSGSRRRKTVLPAGFLRTFRDFVVHLPDECTFCASPRKSSHSSCALTSTAGSRIIINLIAGTSTETRLVVKTRLDRRAYKRAVKVFKKELEALDLKPHKAISFRAKGIAP